MWLATCPELFGTPDRRWLKPGQSYHIGRTALRYLDVDRPDLNNVVNITTQMNTISRNHLVISVGQVDPAWAKTMHHSLITLFDAGSRRGTKVVGKTERNMVGKEVLALTDHVENNLEIFLGNCPYPLKLEWKPMVLSFSLSSKEKKAGLIDEKRKLVGEYDIKCLEGYAAPTTMAVAEKRNTAVGLQALVNGRHIVTRAYVDALSAVCEAPMGRMSLLEENFDENFPDPMKFVPPVMGEPIPRDESVLKPSEARKTVFEGVNLVVCDQTQYESFLGAVTDGGGKLHRFWIAAKTKAQDIVDYTKECDGLLVAWPQKKDGDADLQKECETLLGLELVMQNEFLDTILMCNVAAMRRPFVPEDDMVVEESRVPETPQVPAIEVSMQDAQRADSSNSASLVPSTNQLSTSSRGARGRPKKKILDLMDDFFDSPAPDSQPYVAPEPSPTPESAPPIRNNRAHLDSFDMTSSQAIPDSQDQDEEPVPRRGQRASSKRPAPVDEEEEVLELAPAAAAKRRKIAEERQRRGPSEDVDMEASEPPAVEPPPAPEPVPKKTTAKATKATKSKFTETEQKVIDASRTLLTQQSSSRANANQNLVVSPTSRSPSPSKQNPADELPEEAISNLRSLALVELVPIPERKEKPQSKELKDRWNPAWNGRANFKRFRRVDKEGMTTRRAGGRIIVEMVEVGNEKLGKEEEEEEESEDDRIVFESQRDKTRNQYQEMPAPVVPVRQIGVFRPGASAKTQSTGTMNTLGASRSTMPTQPVTQSQAASTGRDTINMTPLGAKAGTRQLTLPVSVGRKRAGESQTPAQRKKARQVEESDDSDDGMKFKFKKR